MKHRKLFVTLPVRDLQRSKAFFSALGFSFDPTFSDGESACIVIGQDASVMLLPEGRFSSFTTRAPCDRSTHLQALLAVSCERRDEVDRMVKTAIENGGKTEDEPKDYGFMYDWSFYDLDGHGWGVAWMNPNAEPPAQ
ncbi:MAG: VOC family protein [Polyangiales bacterium]